MASHLKDITKSKEIKDLLEQAKRSSKGTSDVIMDDKDKALYIVKIEKV